MSQDWQEAELPVGSRCVFPRKRERVMSGQETAGREGLVSWPECLEVAGRNLAFLLSHQLCAAPPFFLLFRLSWPSLKYGWYHLPLER